jgi:hypothetical protein
MLFHVYTGTLGIVNGNVINYLDNVNNLESKNRSIGSYFQCFEDKNIFDEKKSKREEIAHSTMKKHIAGNINVIIFHILIHCSTIN